MTGEKTAKELKKLNILLGSVGAIVKLPLWKIGDTKRATQSANAQRQRLRSL